MHDNNARYDQEWVGGMCPTFDPGLRGTRVNGVIFFLMMNHKPAAVYPNTELLLCHHAPPTGVTSPRNKGVCSTKMAVTIGH